MEKMSNILRPQEPCLGSILIAETYHDVEIVNDDRLRFISGDASHAPEWIYFSKASLMKEYKRLKSTHFKN
ncbi:hypothetical protein ACQU0X_25960 [Pseudovibrio ascidiaceicola]|uniref:hypothetical protein n=1 Tax=Pseudovibrio ascidiaceicola TaxID=285279 RepID=UPI003D36E7C6